MGQYSATFRPVRDASVQHQLYGASTAWEALDDIEADNNSTYIFQPVNTDTTGQTVTTVIVLSGSIESTAPKIRIDSATLHVRTYNTSATSGVGGSGSVKTNVTYEIEGTTGSGTASSSTTWTDRTISIDVSLFNNRIGAYEIPVTLATTGTRGTSTKSQDFEGRITQVYLEVTYDNYYDVTVIQCGTGSIQPSVEVREGDSYDSINIVGTDHKVVHVFDGETEVTDQCTHKHVQFTLSDDTLAMTQRGTTTYAWAKDAGTTLTYTSSTSGADAVYGVSRFTLTVPDGCELQIKCMFTLPAYSGDYIYVGKLDTSLPTNAKPGTSAYQHRIAGKTDGGTAEYTITVPGGTHYFDLMNYHAASGSARTASVVFSANPIDEYLENVLYYVVSNVTTNREIKAIFDDYVEVFVKRNGVWLKGDKVFIKAGGAWSEQTPSIDTVISRVFEGKKLLIDGKLN